MEVMKTRFNMKIAFVLSVLLLNEIEGGQVRSKRSLLDFAAMITCGTHRQAIDYLNYGCYCGLGGSGQFLDEVDKCCYRHDNCYRRLRETGICYRWMLYFSSYKHSCTTCASTNKGCSRALCHCDRVAVQCFRKNKNKYNSNLKNVDKKNRC